MKRYLIYCVFAIAFFGCDRQKEFENGTSDVTETNLESTDTLYTEKIFKTADMRFRVKDVQDTKEKLSNVIKAGGGTVTELSIQGTVQKSEKVRLSADSLLELTAYRTDGFITAKVPSDKLDEFTNKIAKMAVFVDQQSMKLDDQSIAYLANQLKNGNRVEAVEQLNKHASKKSNNVETSLILKDDYVDKKIENLIIDNKVKYSNITLNFYQDNTVKKIVVENDNLSDYRPGFFNRLWLSIDAGWIIFKEFLLILTNLWVLFALGIAGYLIFKYYSKKKAVI